MICSSILDTVLLLRIREMVQLGSVCVGERGVCVVGAMTECRVQAASPLHFGPV